MSEPIQSNSHLTFEEMTDVKDLPIYVNLPEPPIGNKIFLIRERGMYVLEQGPTLFRAMACTHAGSGGLAVYDGIPDKEGFFPDKKPVWELPENPTPEQLEEAEKKAREFEWAFNGREVYYAHPACMGMWMLDGGLQHGLTIVSSGLHIGTSPVVSITWMKSKVRQK